MHYKRVLVVCIILFSFFTFSGIAQSHYVPPVKGYNHKTIPAPSGMVYIPGGSIYIKYGQNDSDSTNYKEVSLTSFFIDKTEVTNKQYRDFVNWVIDSIAITKYLQDDKYFKKGKHGDTTKRIDWARVKHNKLFRDETKPSDPKLAPMYDEDGIKKELYLYTFPFLRTNRPNAKDNRYVNKTVNIYPDTKVWATDFPNSQTEIMVQEYFTNPAYDDYPVVGVTWWQAMAYANWRTKITRGEGSKYMRKFYMPYSLPSEAQWVYAAHGQQEGVIEDKNVIKAPRDRKGRLIVNFKQDEGDYNQDGSSYTVPVTSYAPNQFGLYNMYGNVAEWVLDAYSESAWAFVHDQNPVLLYDADSSESDFMKRKVVRGGSWKDNAKELSPYTRDYEVENVPHSYIGFRCVMPAPEVLGKQVSTRKRRIYYHKYIKKSDNKK